MTVICKGETVAADSPTGQYLKDDGSWGVPAGGMTYVNRGDPSTWDFTVSNFTRDGALHDLDLSSIVPAGAVAVVAKVQIIASASAKTFLLGPNGNVNTYNSAGVTTQVANIGIYGNFLVKLDAGRIVHYYATDTNITSINFIVCGWFI